jgi:hypothetical protein
LEIILWINFKIVLRIISRYNFYFYLKFQSTNSLTSYTKKNNNFEGLFHQYFEGLVKNIQIDVSFVCGKIFWTLGIEMWDLNQSRLTCLAVFFGTFFVKKHVETKRWHQMNKFKRQIVAYEILDRNHLEMTFRGFKNDVKNV